jgi:RNA polymerase sigma-70 factor (ECF subfamily)
VAGHGSEGEELAVPVRVFVDPLPAGTWDEAARQDAFAEMYARFRPDLVALCRRVLQNRGDPEGMAQEAFAKAWASIDRFTGARPFWPWVATIARRLCIDELRKGSREYRGREYLRSARGMDVLQPEDLVVQRDDEHTALKALRALPPRDQRLITLRDLNEWSYEEIAGFEGVTVESVRGLLKRARVSLRRAYQASAGALGALAPVASLRRMRHRLAAATVNRLGSAAGRPLAGTGLAEVMATTLTLAIVTSAGMAGVAPVSEVLVAGGSGASDSRPAAPTSGLSSLLDSGSTRAGDQVGPSRSPSAAGASSQPAGDSGSGSAAGLPLPSDGATRPEQVQFERVVAADDGTTLFATGVPRTACPTVSCAVMFKSTDGGQSWKRLPATGFVGGDLLVPPDFASDHRLFAASGLGLHLSTDGGNSFSLVAPLGGPAAMSPKFSSGDPTILIGGAPRWDYDATTQVATPSTLLLPSTSAVTHFAFSPAYATDQVLFAGTTAADSSAGVHRCVDGVCEARAALADLTAVPNLVVSPSFPYDHAVWAWRGKLLYRSGDGGASFRRIALPAGGELSSVVVAADGTYVSRWADETGRHGGLFRTRDDGASWQPVATAGGFAAGVTAITDVNGRLIAAVDATLGDASLLWSDDRGETWQAAR